MKTTTRLVLCLSGYVYDFTECESVGYKLDGCHTTTTCQYNVVGWVLI